jgi:hypothetical protein
MEKMLTVPVIEEALEMLDLIALKHGLSRAEVVRQFISAGMMANPISAEERQRLLAMKRRKGRGLVIPLAPVASATPAADVTGAADENMEKMGIEPRVLVTRGVPLKLAA